MELKYLKGSSIQMMHPFEIEFHMYITGHQWTKATNFGEFPMHRFFLGV